MSIDIQQILLDLQDALEQWNDSAETFGYSPNGDFTTSGEFVIEQYGDQGEIVNQSIRARIVFY